MLAVFTFADGTAAFNQRLDHYLTIRKKASESVHAISNKATPAEIASREASFAKAIQKARPDAQPGDIFTPGVRPMFLSMMKDAFTGPAGANRRAMVRQGNPKVHPEPGEAIPTVQVNAVYPTSASLSTVPASLLMKLPKLPPEMEYRFVGRTLILRDREANLIIDFLPEAVPAQ